MARKLIIVSRQHPELHAYLARHFTGDPEVVVILDRRLGERRQQQVGLQRERRVGNRRSRPEIDDILRTRSHVIVVLEDADNGRPEGVGAADED